MTCQKVPYLTRGGALDDIRALGIQHKSGSKKAAVNQKSNRKLNAYQYPRCGSWHLTSLKPVKNK